MVKVYDMVTYEVCEPEQDATTPDHASIHAERMAAVPAVGLQLIEVTPTSMSQALHPSLRYTDVSGFLAALGD